MSELNEQEKIRRGSLLKLKELGINPFPAEEFIINANSVEIKENFSETEKQLSKCCFGRKNNE